jgi:GT2 family glycosyltransferase
LIQPKVSVIIVNWNGKSLLEECLDSLAAQTAEGMEIILVDNGSHDGSAEYVRKRFPSVRIVLLSENLGFAGGNNAGIKVARGEYIALLNNDTKVDPAWLENLLTTIESSPPSTGMWASKILSYENPDIFDNVGLLLYPDGLGRGKGRLEKDRGQYDRPGEAFFPSGCAGLYSREVLTEVGLFDEDFFAYADDVDVGLRARLAGWGCQYVPSAKVYHKYSASSAAYSPMKAFLVERNRIWVLFKYFPPELILLSPIFTLVRLFVHLFGAITGKGASGKFTEQHSIYKAMTILFKAWWAAILGFHRIFAQRHAISRLRRISRLDFYRLLCMFRLSVREVALKN